MGCNEAPRVSSPPSDTPVADTLAEFLNQRGDEALFHSDYQQALTLYEQSIQAAWASGDSAQAYVSKLDLAGVYERMSQPQKSVALGEEVLAACIAHRDTPQIGRTYSTLAAFYLAAGQTEQGIAAIQKALPLLETHGSLIERCAAMNQLAFTYSGRNRWPEALPYLDSALVLMRQSGVLDQLPGLSLNLGDCHRRLEHWTEARYYLNAAVAGADSLGQLHVKARAMERISQVDEATGHPAEAIRLYRRAVALKDSIFKADKVRAIDEMLVKFETGEKERQIAVLQAAESDARAARNLAWAAVVVLLVLAAAAGFWVYQRARHRRLTLQQNEQNLSDLTTILLEKNALLAELNQQVTVLSANPPPTDLTGETPYDNILTKEDWLRFKAYFEKVYPGFIAQLNDRYSDISEAEQRIFLFVKLGISSGESATILGVSPTAIKKSRHRLRKRLNLPEGADLDEFIRAF